MIESLLFRQDKVVPASPKPDITFKTSGTMATTVAISSLGFGFTAQYSIDGADFVPAGASFTIPAGNHEVTLKLDVTSGTYLRLTAINDILTEITDWEGFQLPSIQFMNCSNLTKVPDYLPSAIRDMGYMFFGCTSFNHAIGSWDVGKVTNIQYMFYDCSSFNQYIGKWNTSKVANMSNIFYGCTTFNQDISQWDVSKVDDIDRMFYNARSFNQDLSSMVFKSSVIRDHYDQGANAWNQAYRPKFTG